MSHTHQGTAFLALKVKRRSYPHRKDGNEHPIIDLCRHLERRVGTFGGHAAVLCLFPLPPQRLVRTHLRNSPESIVRTRNLLPIATVAPSTPDSLPPCILNEFVRHIVVILDADSSMHAETKDGRRFLVIFVRKPAAFAFIKDKGLEGLRGFVGHICNHLADSEVGSKVLDCLCGITAGLREV